MKQNVLKTAVALAALTAPAFAGEPVVAPTKAPASSALTADLSLGYHSNYVYRGWVADEDVISDVLSLGLGLTYNDGSGNELFADVYHRNYDIGSIRGFGFGGPGQDHTTVTAGVRRELAPGLVGTLAYAFNTGGLFLDENLDEESGHEIQAKLDYAVTKDFVVYGLAAYEFNVFEGYYFEAGAAYNYALTDQVSLVLSGAVSYSEGYFPDFNTDNSGFNAVEVKLAAPIAVSQQFTVAPYVAYVSSLGVSDNYDVTNVTESDRFVGGVEATLSF